MMFSDDDIHYAITTDWVGYTPYDRSFVNPASIDMRLGDLIRIPDPLVTTLDVAEIQPDHTDQVQIDAEGYVLDPGDFILATTVERVTLPADIVGRVEGKSSIGRLGLAVHITAGFIDPGFEGEITLEVANLAPWSITIRPGMRIAQMAFTRMNSTAKKPYGRVGHYQGQRGPVESRYKM